jgi:transcriptional regulator GlxA family with amidase domain
LIENPEVARALVQQMLHAIIHCLADNDADDNHKMRHHHAAVMARFEEALNGHIDQKISMPELCGEIGVPERTLRTCCAKFLGVSPARYLLLQRLNKARSALQCADPSTTSVAEVALNHQFLELGRFAVTYHLWRIAFNHAATRFTKCQSCIAHPGRFGQFPRQGVRLHSRNMILLRSAKEKTVGGAKAAAHASAAAIEGKAT